MHYLIDGYNFIFAKKDTDEKDLLSERKDLISLIAKAFAKSRDSITIVFDAKHQSLFNYASFEDFEKIEIVYSPKNETADDYILELIEYCKNPKEITVITSDNYLSSRCKELRSYTKKINSFIKWIEKLIDKNQNTFDEKPSSDTSSQEKRLEEEFTKRLKRNSKKE